MKNAAALVSQTKDTRPNEIIYQIYPSSFCDSNGDGIGDLRGIIERLDYIAGLNVDAIWINPIFPSASGPEGDGGYAVDTHRAIAPRFGTMADFEDLLDAAHERGLRVYLDFVLPHTSSRHEWYQASSDPQHPEHQRYKDFYVWDDGVKPPAPGCANGCLVNCASCTPVEDSHAPPNNWLSVFGGPAWTWNEKRNQYGLAHFLPSQPALNFEKEEVVQAVLADMKFLLDKGVDGLRLDSVPYANYDPQLRNNPWLHGYWDSERNGWEHQRFDHSMCQPQTVELIARIRELADSYPHKVTLIGEVIAGREGGRNPKEIAMDYVDPERGLDSCYTTTERAIGLADPGYIRDMIKGYQNSFPDGGLCFTVSDHDGFKHSPRAATRLTAHVPDEYKESAYRQGLEIYAAIPGTLSLYMGDELGLPHADSDDIPEHLHKDPIRHTKGRDFCRDGARTPLPMKAGAKNAGFSHSDDPYLPVPNSHHFFAADVQERNPASTLNFVKNLMAWRQAQPALIKGKTEFLPTYGDTLAFLRRDSTQALLCVFNLGKNEIHFKPSDLLDEKTLAEVGLKRDQIISLRPYGAAFPGEYKVETQRPPAPVLKSSEQEEDFGVPIPAHA